MAVHIRIETSHLDPESLRKEIDTEGCGSIVSFVGITRGQEDGHRGDYLEFDAWEDALPGVLSDIAEQPLADFGVKCIAMSHRIGVVPRGEPIVCIHVAVS